MPAPDPFAVYLEEGPDGRPVVVWEVWPSKGAFAQGNRRHRMNRGKSIRQNLRFGGWACRWCDDPVPLWRRADARYCCESCRKRAKRQWRALYGTCR